MGLGKTLQTISLLSYLKFERGVQVSSWHLGGVQGLQLGDASRQKNAIAQLAGASFHACDCSTAAHLSSARLPLSQGPHLVVVPLSVLPSWLSEFQRWSPQAGGRVEGCKAVAGLHQCNQLSTARREAPVPSLPRKYAAQPTMAWDACPKSYRRFALPQMRVVRLHTGDHEERQRLKREVLGQPESFDVAVTT